MANVNLAILELFAAYKNRAQKKADKANKTVILAWNSLANMYEVHFAPFKGNKLVSQVSIIHPMQKNPTTTSAKRIVSARMTLKNPNVGYDDDVMATEFATLLHTLKEGKALREHFAKTTKKADFSRAKYIAYVAKNYIPKAAIAYYRGNVAEAKRFSSVGTNKLAGKYFVEAIEEGNYN